LDITTGLLIWTAEALTLAVLLGSRWLYQREGFYLSWALGFALHGIGVGLVAMRGEIPDFVSIQVANGMALTGISMWMTGLLQFDRRSVETFCAIPPLIWVAGMFLIPVRETFAYRVALYNAAAMVGYLVMIAILLRKQDASRVTRRMLAGCLAVQAVCGGAAGILAIINGTTSFMGTGTGAALLFFPAAFCFIAGIMCTAKLLTERSEQELKALAATDPLTGVLNRRGLMEEFEVLRAGDDPQKPLIAFLHFDLDHFKQVNDACGHQAGDTVLVAFSRIASASLRDRGAFGRMGGEEFASILRVADLIEAASIAEGIRMTLSLQAITAGIHRIKVTVSAGVALMPASDANLDRLLNAADRALYAAKAAGRDRTAVENDGQPLILPTSEPLSEEEVTAEIRADRQVRALRSVTAISGG
jgi:diguanylate cyclase (GGDEF)-like protein